jgi:hypothetical protein
MAGLGTTTMHGLSFFPAGFEFKAYSLLRLCIPALPFTRRKHLSPPFYALDSELPLALAIATGFQHSLAMLAGLITPPIIFASTLNLDSATSAYMISASLIGCGMSFPLVAVQYDVL